MSQDALIRQVFDEVREANKRPMLHYVLSREPVGLCDSKVGGVPYMAHDDAWPLDEVGDPLGFLAQIDCVDLAPLPDFPHEGLLQFFIGTDIAMGLGWGEEPKGFRIYYRETVDPSVTEEEVTAKMPDVDPDVDYENFPLWGDDVYKMTFDSETVMQPITYGDWAFDALYAQRWNELRPELSVERFFDVSDHASEEDVVDELMELSDSAFDWVTDPDGQAGNQCGGYPSFMQEDPRWDGDDVDTLLFQLNTTMNEGPDGERDFLVSWGDAGIGNFFINGEALVRRDFSNVVYHWDCG